MKKLIIMMILVLVSGFSAQSEILTMKKVTDRFGDTLYCGPQKTIIVRDGNNTISIEEKGKERVVYTLDSLVSRRGSPYKGGVFIQIQEWTVTIGGEACIIGEAYFVTPSRYIIGFDITYPDGKRTVYLKEVSF